MASAPFSIQKTTIRFVEPMIMGGLTILWLYIISSIIGISLFVIFSTLLLIVICVHYYNKHQHSSVDSIEHDDTFDNVPIELSLHEEEDDWDNSVSSFESLSISADSNIDNNEGKSHSDDDDSDSYESSRSSSVMDDDRSTRSNDVANMVVVIDCNTSMSHPYTISME